MGLRLYEASRFFEPTQKSDAAFASFYQMQAQAFDNLIQSERYQALLKQVPALTKDIESIALEIRTYDDEIAQLQGVMGRKIEKHKRQNTREYKLYQEVLSAQSQKQFEQMQLQADVKRITAAQDFLDQPQAFLIKVNKLSWLCSSVH
ncbi:MAG: hypothetical protein R3A45_09795 [Bdellovibrionota bacterium]